MSIVGGDLNNRHEIIKSYRFEINEKLMKIIHKVLGYPINNLYYDEYKQDNIYYLDSFMMNDLFDKICRRYNDFQEFNKPVGIADEEFSYFLNKYNMQMNMLNKYFENGKCLFDINDLFYEDNYLFCDIEKIVLIFNELRTIKEEIYDFRNYKSIKPEVLDSLSYFIDKEELDRINNEYTNLLKSPSNLIKIRSFIENINQITKQDYMKRLSDLNNLNGLNFSFIVHSIKTDNWKGKFYDSLVSASLISNELKGLYSYPAGFILDPSSMISANSNDTYTSNSNYQNSFSTVGILPIIYSYDKVIYDCKKKMVENPSTKVYNEVVLTQFNPLAIFYYPDSNDFGKHIAINLRNQVEEYYPNLKIMEIGSTAKFLNNDQLQDNFKKTSL